MADFIFSEEDTPRIVGPTWLSLPSHFQGNRSVPPEWKVNITKLWVKFGLVNIVRSYSYSYATISNVAEIINIQQYTCKSPETGVVRSLLTWSGVSWCVPVTIPISTLFSSSKDLKYISLKTARTGAQVLLEKQNNPIQHWSHHHWREGPGTPRLHENPYTILR